MHRPQKLHCDNTLCPQAEVGFLFVILTWQLYPEEIVFSYNSTNKTHKQTRQTAVGICRYEDSLRYSWYPKEELDGGVGGVGTQGSQRRGKGRMLSLSPSVESGARQDERHTFH